MMALGIIQNHTLSVQGLPLQKHHGSLLGFSILYCVNFLATSFPAIRCWEVANCHWIYHQICQDWGPITNMKLLMVAFPRFSWTSNYQYISYVCVFPTNLRCLANPTLAVKMATHYTVRSHPKKAKQFTKRASISAAAPKVVFTCCANPKS